MSGVAAAAASVSATAAPTIDVKSNKAAPLSAAGKLVVFCGHAERRVDVDSKLATSRSRFVAEWLKHHHGNEIELPCCGSDDELDIAAALLENRYTWNEQPLRDVGAFRIRYYLSMPMTVAFIPPGWVCVPRAELEKLLKTNSAVQALASELEARNLGASLFRRLPNTHEPAARMPRFTRSKPHAAYPLVSE